MWRLSILQANLVPLRVEAYPLVCLHLPTRPITFAASDRPTEEDQMTVKYFETETERMRQSPHTYKVSSGRLRTSGSRAVTIRSGGIGKEGSHGIWNHSVEGLLEEMQRS